MSLPLFHGTRWPTVTFVDSMTISFRVKGDSVCSYGGSLSDPSQTFRNVEVSRLRCLSLRSATAKLGIRL